jgi:hypothetical protein
MGSVLRTRTNAPDVRQSFARGAGRPPGTMQKSDGHLPLIYPSNFLQFMLELGSISIDVEIRLGTHCLAIPTTFTILA